MTNKVEDEKGIAMRGVGLTVAILVVGGALVLGRNFLRTSGIAAPPANAPPKLVWDFTKGTDMRVVGWPADVGGQLWRVDSPVRITLIAPDGQHGEFDAHSFQVRRESGQIRSVLISMQNEESSAAYARAKSLAQEWGIMTPAKSEAAREAQRRLDQWFAGFKPGGTGKGVRMCELGRNDLWPQRSVSIRSSYDDKLPWFVGLGLGALNEPPTSKPANPDTVQ